MQVVDTVEVHVLSVPCKKCLPHAKVEVSCVDTWDMDPLLCQTVQYGRQVVDVPLLEVRGHQTACQVSTVQSRIECDVLPELSLQLFKVFGFGRAVPTPRGIDELAMSRRKRAN